MREAELSELTGQQRQGNPACPRPRPRPDWPDVGGTHPLLFLRNLGHH